MTAFVDPNLSKVAGVLRPGVPVSVIVVTRDPAGATRAREVEAVGGRATYTSKLAPHVHADVPPEAVEQIARSGAVKEVWHDAPMYALPLLSRNPLRSTVAEIRARMDVESQARAGLAPTPGAGLASYLGLQGPSPMSLEATILGLDDVRRLLRVDEANAAGATGKGVRVAVIDTGINGTHPMLDGKVSKHLSFVQEDPGTDLSGHGTWTSSCVAGNPVEYQGKIAKMRGRVLQGMAPDAELLDMKVLTGEGAGSTSGVIQGIEAAVDEKVDVISMSLGNLLGQAGRSPDAVVVDEASRKGVVVVAAAGNSFIHGTVGSPASAAGAVAVGSVAGATPFRDAVSSFSSKGPLSNGKVKPDIASVGGQFVPGLGPGNEVILGATSGSMAHESGEEYGLERGTSMSTPSVAGIVALAIPKGFPRERSRIEAVLARAARTRLGLVPFKDNRVGWGVVDAVRVIEASSSLPSLPVRGWVGAQTFRERPVIGAASARIAALRRRSSGEASDARLTLT